MTKASKNKWKSFKKTLIKMEKRDSMEHQNPTRWVVVKRRGKALLRFYPSPMWSKMVISCPVCVFLHLGMEGLERIAFDDVHFSSAYDSIFVTKKSAWIIIRCRNKTPNTRGNWKGWNYSKMVQGLVWTFIVNKSRSWSKYHHHWRTWENSVIRKILVQR